jgi:hypothetical protein
MDDATIDRFVEQVSADAIRALGPAADPALLDRYARDAVLDLWLTRPQLTLAAAQLALARLRQSFAAPPRVAALLPTAA